MAERGGKKEKAKRRAEKSREKVISSFVVISIVLSVLAASVATVSAPNGGVPPPPGPAVTEIVVTASPESIPADGSSTSTIIATVTNWTNKETPDNFTICFGFVGDDLGAHISTKYDTYNKTDSEGKAYATLTAGLTPGTVTIKAWWNESVFNTTTVTLLPPPEIVTHAPIESPVKDNEGAARTFSITVNQPANVTWLINGTVKQINESVPAYTPCNYTNESAVAGVWNVSALVENPNGTTMQTWIWKVSRLERIEVLPSEATLQVGDEMQFNAIAYDQFNEIMSGIIFTWSSSNTTVGEVNETGYFIAKSPGETFVNATNQSVVGSAHVTVTPGPLARIEVSPSEITLNVGETCQFEAKGYDKFDNEIPGLIFTWSSSNTTVGTVNETGFFTALYPGFTFVNATNQSVVGSARVNVTYIPKVTTVVVSPSEVTLNITETLQFTATAYDQFGNEMPDVAFTWSSSNTTVGTVNETGFFTALYPGFTFVNATAPNGVNGTASVTVTYTPKVTTIMIEPAEATIYEGDTQEFTATAYDQIGREMPEITDFAWSSTNLTVGTVSPTTGKTTVFTALKAGNTTVIASAAGVSNTSAVHVRPRPDLVVEEITPNPDCGGYLFANESNEMCAVVKNNGSGDALPFNISFIIGGFSKKERVDSLAAGANTTICITDPTKRNADDTVTIIVTADCDNEINETNEMNNDKSTEKIVVNNGYKGKRYTGGEDISTWRTYELNGSVLYSVGDSYYLSAWSYPNWTTYTVNWSASDLPVPTGATVVEARLYVIYTWDKAGVMPDEVSLTFNKEVQTLEAHYSDRKGYGEYNYPYGMLVYNVTDVFNTSGNTAILNNMHAGGGNVSIRGMLLVVVYADESEPMRQIFINEGFDMLYGGSDMCTTSEEATAFAPFSGTIEDIANKSARLITVAPGAGPNEGELIFNGHVWNDVWNFAGDSQIGIDDRDVTAYLNTTNEAGFQSRGDYMEASNAILVVESKVAITFELPLDEEWNLISLPLIPENTSIDEIFKNATGGDRVYAYSNGSFTSSEYYEGYGWYPKMEIIPDKGYWYYAVSAYNATITGKAAVENRTVPMSAGWNLVGYTSLRTRPVGEVINEPHGGDRIYAYIEGAFESSEYYEGYGWYPEMDMEPGRGYWYYTDTPFVWEYSP